MTIAMTSAPPTSPRWLLPVSLALNLFFIGIAGAMLLRPYVAAPSVNDRSDAARTERIAATLPHADADKLRQAFSDRRAEIDAARGRYRQAQDKVRDALRAEPFRADVMQAATNDTRAARQNFDQTLHGMFIAAASTMTPAGRNKLADWPPGPRP